MAFAWEPSLSIGHAEIDDQHQEIFARAAALAEAIEGGKATEELAGTLGFLAAHVREHFGAEEGMMLVHAYPLVDVHRDQHRGFMRAVGMMRDRFEEEGPTRELREELESFLVSWLRDHIGSSDRALARWLAERNRPADAPAR